jgi:hypothetical protein
MKTPTSARKHKHFVLNQAKLKKAQRILRTRTETETIDRALDDVIDQHERNRRAWAATEELLKSRVRLRDVFGRLEE